MTDRTLYKVILPGGKPCHGGNAAFTWPLPKGKRPGAWVAVEGPLVLCQNALHLTADPIDWYQVGAELYEAEYRGEMVDGGNKLGCREARLVRLVDWEAAQVFESGEHSVITGKSRASGSATVRASGSATVWASGSATVISSQDHRAGADLVTLFDLAVHVDRRDAKVVLSAARGEIGTVVP